MQADEHALLILVAGLVFGGLGGDDGGFGGRDAGGSGVGDVGDEEAAPVGGSGAGQNVLHVEDRVFELLIEDALLNFIGSL